jgi:hypothetical protein
VREDYLMSDIGAVAPAEKPSAVDPHQQPARGRGKTARRTQPRKPRSADEMVEVETHTLDLEA